MNVVEANVPQADFSRLMARGGSRGGNIALLLAVRDPRVTVASAASAPTDFYRAEVAARYARQYQCQFIEGKTPEESRRRMLASSPLRFPILRNVNRVYLDQGSADDVVPSWNAEEMAAALRTQSVNLEYHLYPGYGHDRAPPEFRVVQHQIYESSLYPDHIHEGCDSAGPSRHRLRSRRVCRGSSGWSDRAGRASALPLIRHHALRSRN